jgi:hypothetical protein
VPPDPPRQPPPSATHGGIANWAGTQSARVVAALGVLLVLCGCGVRSAESKRADCDAIVALTHVKSRMDRLDQRISDSRRQEITLDGLRSLARTYRAAAASYGRLAARAADHLAQARSAGRAADVTATWAALLETLKTRRVAIRFYATAFAHPLTLSGATLARGQVYSGRADRLAARLQSRTTALLRTRGFEERAGGRAVITC